MKRLLLAAAIVMAAALPAISAYAEDPAMIEFNRRCGFVRPAQDTLLEPCQAFVQGFVHGLASANAICLPPVETPRETLMIVQKYLRDHPERVSAPRDMAITDALIDAFGCGTLLRPPALTTGPRE